MDYKEQNDQELLNLIFEHNEEAELELVRKYTGLIYKIVKKYKDMAYSFGIEESDLVQEGFIGLKKAIDTYNVEKEVLFYTYVSLCVETNILSALRKANRKKNENLNNSISLESLSENEIYNIDEILKDDTYNPYYRLEEKDEELSEINKIVNDLTDFEKKVFILKLRGLTNEEIALKLSKNKRSIENTLYRIKLKYRDIKSK